MKLFQHSQGFVIAFGFDMITRRRSSNMICWSDPADQAQWEASATNQAGWNMLPYIIAPEFVHECDGGKVVAYQEGMCIEMTPIGAPFIWSFKLMFSDKSPYAALAA